MSLESWQAQYYSVPAEKATGSDREAIEHCLVKWRGLRVDNRNEHEVMRSGGNLRGAGEDGEFHVDNSTCALCARYLDSDCRRPEDAADKPGEMCPLKNLRGGVDCADWSAAHDGPRDSPYERFVVRGDPEPMIKLLERALASTTSEEAK